MLLLQSFSKLAVFLLILILSTHATAEADWELKKDKQGIKISTRAVENSSFKSFKGEVTLKTSLSTLMAIHADVAYVKEWMKDCDESELLSELRPDGYSAYFKTDSPWPVKDRDYALKYTISQDPKDYSLTLAFTSEVGLVPKSDDCVRITELSGFWKMTPIDAEHIKIIYQVEADPAGSVPAWLANNFVVDQPYESLKRLKERVKMDKYQNKTFVFVKEAQFN